MTLSARGDFSRPLALPIVSARQDATRLHEARVAIEERWRPRTTVPQLISQQRIVRAVRVSPCPRQLAPIRRDDIQEFPRFQPPTLALQHVNPFGPALSEGPGDDWREQLGAAVEGLKVHKSH